MTKTILSALALSLVPLATAEKPRIYPTPQKNFLMEGLTTIKEVKVSIYTQLDLKKIKPSRVWTAMPRKEGAYGFIIRPRALYVVAYDETGAFYARQTLIQLLAQTKGEEYLNAQKDPTEAKSIEQLVLGNKLPLGDFFDWPDMPFRGSIEGYYGEPWSHEDRIRQFEFYGRNKMNTYIWAPKFDPYHHGAKSYELYPEKEAAEIRELCAVAKKNHVKFIWMVHPANTIKWANEGGKPDLDRLVTKLEAMYDLGVRDFAVSVDDSSGEIGKASNQIVLCNYIKEQFIDKKKDVGPLIMCPTGYNKSWTNPAYIKELGQGLHKDIHVMWTGNTVCHDITQEGQEWVLQALGRPTFIWWNWPVHDYCPAHLPMGRTYGLEQSKEMRKLMTGFTSNPMALAEASKTGLFGVGDYSWNIMGFDSMANWKDGMKRLYPTSHEAVQIFANHNSDLGKNYHGYRREESVEFAPIAQRITEGFKQGEVDAEALAAADKEFRALKAATETIASGADTKLLAAEIKPWLALSAELGEVGADAVTLVKEPTLKNFALIQGHWDKFNEGAPNRTQHAPLVSGWRVLRPLIFSMVDYSQDKIFEQEWAQKRKDDLQSQAASASKSQPHVQSNVKELENLSVSRKENKYYGIDKVLEVKTLPAQGYVEIVFPTPVDASWLEVNLDNATLPQWAEIELSLADGSSVKPAFDMQGTVLTSKGGQLPPKRIASMKLTNKSEAAQEVKFNMFKLDCKPIDARFDPNSMMDRDLLSYLDVSEGYQTELTIPAGCTRLLVIGNSLTVNGTEGSEQAALLEVPSGTKAFKLDIKPQQGARVYEIIFK